MSSQPEPPLILASTSPYRERLLARLGLAFTTAAPKVAEQARAGESPAALARRLGAEKALAVSQTQPDAWVLGSDQVAALDAQILGKPGTRARAREQLGQCSGRTVRFYTSVALARAAALRGERLVETTVHFRTLSDAMINDYLERESPYDCAGSFRWEALGIALFESLQSNDPTALEGLPLIATCDLLAEVHVAVLARG